MRWGYVVRNVADAVDLPKVSAPEMRVWSPEQLRTFLAHVRADRLFAAWMLFATTGMRRGEVAGLRWTDVDLRAGQVKVAKPRVAVRYQVHVSEPKTLKASDGWPGPGDGGGTPRAPQPPGRGAAHGGSWLGGIRAGVHLAGWPSAAPGAVHPLVPATRPGCRPPEDPPPRRAPQLRDRRAGGRRARQVVSERLGHATIAITMDTYSHVLPGMDERAASAVARLILGDEAAPPARVP